MDEWKLVTRHYERLTFIVWVTVKKSIAFMGRFIQYQVLCSSTILQEPRENVGVDVGRSKCTTNVIVDSSV